MQRHSPVNPAPIRRRFWLRFTSSRIICPCTRKVWFRLLTRRLSRMRAGSVLGAKPNSFEHCSNEVCYCVELTCDPPPWASRTSQGRVAVHRRGDSGQCACQRCQGPESRVVAADALCSTMRRTLHWRCQRLFVGGLPSSRCQNRQASALLQRVSRVVCSCECL